MLQHLLDTRVQPAGWLLNQSAETAAATALPRLETQGLMGLALLDLYHASSDTQWLDEATASIDSYTETLIEDANGRLQPLVPLTPVRHIPAIPGLSDNDAARYLALIGSANRLLRHSASTSGRSVAGSL